MIRCRVSYQKVGPLRFISHLDLQKVWIRVLLRAKMPLAYTQGFHPSPKMATAWPLPLGWDGRNELIDLWFKQEAFDQNEDWTERLITHLNQKSPGGLIINSIEPVELFSPAITTLIQSADYQVKLPIDTDTALLAEKAQEFLSKDTVLRSRRNKEYNLRSFVESEIRIETESAENPSFYVTMTAKDSAMGRPDELADELGLMPEDLSFIRDRFHLISPPKPE